MIIGPSLPAGMIAMRKTPLSRKRGDQASITTGKRCPVPHRPAALAFGPWQMSIPRANSRSSPLRSDNGNRTYIIKTGRMISVDALKERSGLEPGFIRPIYRPPAPPAIVL